ncbi:MAG: hypothetical protein ABTA16_00290 [Niallia sp.]
MYINCPKCKSENIYARVLMCGFAKIDMKTGKTIEIPNDYDFSPDEIRDLYCRDCNNNWLGGVSEILLKEWK